MPRHKEVRAEAKQIGDLIRQMRLKQGWSLADLGAVAQLSAQHIYAIEKGQMMPKRQTLERLSHALNVPLDTFLALAPVQERERGLFGTLLYEARTQKQWTQGEVAFATHISEARIASYENSFRFPLKQETVELLAQVLHIPIEELLQAWHPPRSAADRMHGDLMKCTHCHREKPLSAFHKNSYVSNGLQSSCKECRKELRQSKNVTKAKAATRARLRETWPYRVTDGPYAGLPARIIDPPRKAYKPHLLDGPDPVWCQFESRWQPQWFPRGRLQSLED